MPDRATFPQSQVGLVDHRWPGLNDGPGLWPSHFARADRFQGRRVRGLAHAIPPRIILGRLHQLADDFLDTSQFDESDRPIPAVLQEATLSVTSRSESTPSPETQELTTSPSFYGIAEKLESKMSIPCCWCRASISFFCSK